MWNLLQAKISAPRVAYSVSIISLVRHLSNFVLIAESKCNGRPTSVIATGVPAPTAPPTDNPNRACKHTVTNFAMLIIYIAVALSWYLWRTPLARSTSSTRGTSGTRSSSACSRSSCSSSLDVSKLLFFMVLLLFHFTIQITYVQCQL